VGSRATDKLKEIEELRSGIEHKLGELEQRIPLAGFGRKAVTMLAGGSAGGTVLAFAVRRLRGGRRRAKVAKQAAHSPAVTVNVFPRGASWVAAAGLAAWAGARLYEAYTRSRTPEGDAQRPVMIKPMPEAGRRTGS